jgi:hypothetical protein
LAKYIIDKCYPSNNCTCWSCNETWAYHVGYMKEFYNNVHINHGFG